MFSLIVFLSEHSSGWIFLFSGCVFLVHGGFRRVQCSYFDAELVCQVFIWKRGHKSCSDGARELHCLCCSLSLSLWAVQWSDFILSLSLSLSLSCACSDSHSVDFSLFLRGQAHTHTHTHTPVHVWAGVFGVWMKLSFHFRINTLEVCWQQHLVDVWGTAVTCFTSDCWLVEAGKGRW